MQNLMNTSVLTMSSQEIAGLVASRHDNVRTTIEKLVKRGVIQLPVMQEVKNNQGQTTKVYHLGKRDSFVVVAQLSPEFTGRLVDRWQELEAKEIRASAYREYRQLSDWMEARETGKQARLAETDTIKVFVEYATSQGSKSAKMYYMNITKGTYAALFVLEHGGKWEGIRDCLSRLQLTTLSSAEQIALKALREAMEMDMHYKDAYKYAIGKVKGFAELIGVTKIPDEPSLKLVKPCP